MSNPRPGGVTLICILSVLGALFDLVMAQRNVGDFETSRWVDAHPRQAQFEQFYHYIDAGVTLLACYFMMQAHSWARWLYLGWNLARFGTAIALMFVPKLQEDLGFLELNFSMIRSAIIFLFALWLLWRADAREYFANARNPHWRE
jgi:hypothetical protein